MKRNYTLLLLVLVLFLFSSVSILAQTPEKMSYQLVLRGASNTLLTNQQVGIQISILQSTITGSAVYTETQTATTNINGLVSLEIGTGAGSNDFSAIDWSAGPFFIKTATDASGGSNYSIIGTSQLMSVPFALYAKTAGNDELKENTANKSTNIVTDAASDVKFPSVKSVKTYVDAVQDDVDANETASTTSDATLQGYIDALEARIAALESQTPATVGDLRDGGVVFWVDPENNTHGLVCAIRDLSPRIRWYNGTNTTTGATGSTIGTGSANTTAIIANQGATETSYAAGLARAYSGGGYTDWFLPSKEELNQMYLNKATINTTALANGGSNFPNYYYWSSTENASNNVWLQYFASGFQTKLNKNTTYYVRAVRAF
jgi:hypothetical protein